MTSSSRLIRSWGAAVCLWASLLWVLAVLISRRWISLMLMMTRFTAWSTRRIWMLTLCSSCRTDSSCIILCCSQRRHSLKYPTNCSTSSGIRGSSRIPPRKRKKWDFKANFQDRTASATRIKRDKRTSKDSSKTKKSSFCRSFRNSELICSKRRSGLTNLALSTWTRSLSSIICQAPSTGTHSDGFLRGLVWRSPHKLTMDTTTQARKWAMLFTKPCQLAQTKTINCCTVSPTANQSWASPC